ncbi:MAG: FtsQ-type POTRA domain-containing protein, partial [Pseudomonadota bacterium]
MPAVKGKGRKTPAKGKRKGGGRRKKPQGVWANVKDMSARVWEGVLTYTAVGFAALAVVVVLMLFAGGYFWNISERVETLTIRAAKAMGFSVERVTVKGATYLSDRDIMQSLWDDQTGSILGRSLLNVDAQDARQKIENLAWVEYAAVQKLWPNTVHVSVRERKP